MLTENTANKLQEMKLTAMARAFKAQLTDPDVAGYLLKTDLVSLSTRNGYPVKTTTLSVSSRMQDSLNQVFV